LSPRRRHLTVASTPPGLWKRHFRHNPCTAVVMDLVLMIVVALAAALAGLAGVYLGMKIDGRRRRKLDT
jgi:branched-subunit amino acid ABC-type transport system permease component